MLFIYVVFHNNIFNSEKKAYLSITGENRGNEREKKEKSKKGSRHYKTTNFDHSFVTNFSTNSSRPHIQTK